MKRIALFLMSLALVFSVKAQVLTPVKWSYAAKKINKNEAVLFVKASIDEGWHIYSTKQPDGGPKKTKITFEPSSAYTLVGDIMEPKAKTVFNSNYGINLMSFERTVIFQQKIKLKSGQTTVKGKVESMTCNDHQCLPPETVGFTIPVK